MGEAGAGTKAIKQGRPYLRILLASVLVGVLAVLYFNPQIKVADFDRNEVMQQLKAVAVPDYMDQQIQQMLADGDINLAKQYLAVADILHVIVPQSTQDAVAAEDIWLKSSGRNIIEFSEGLVMGSGDSAAAVAGGVFSDFTVVGDVRDLSAETWHYLNDEPVDTMTASLSAMGIALTAATVLSVGGAALESVPGKMAISLLKAAKKGGKLSVKFLASLRKILKKAVNLEAIFKKTGSLHGMDGLNLNKWSEVIGSAAKYDIKMNKVDAVIESVSSINKSTGSISNSMKMLRYADNPKELKLVAKLSRSFGKRSYAVMKILGKSALKVSKRAMKMMASIFAAIVSLCYGLLTFVTSAFMRRFFMRLVFNRTG